MDFPDPMGSIQSFEGVSVEIKPDGSVGSVVDHYPYWPTESRQHTFPLREFLPDSIESGLPLITIPGSKLEPGRVQPAFGLAGAERRADQALAARSLLGPAADIAARNAA